MTALMAAWLLCGVVDQLDGPTAALEWEGTRIESLPTEWLPSGTREGDHVCLRIRRKPAQSRHFNRAARPRNNPKRRVHDRPKTTNRSHSNHP